MGNKAWIKHGILYGIMVVELLLIGILLNENRNSREYNDYLIQMIQKDRAGISDFLHKLEEKRI